MLFLKYFAKCKIVKAGKCMYPNDLHVSVHQKEDEEKRVREEEGDVKRWRGWRLHYSAARKVFLTG